MAKTRPDSEEKQADHKGDPSLSPSVERQINENLKRLYAQASEEPLPDHLLKLLEKLKQESGTR